MPTTLRAAHCFFRGYNAQAVATADQLTVAAEITQETNDVRQLAPLIEATNSGLVAAGLEGPWVPSWRMPTTPGD